MPRAIPMGYGEQRYDAFLTEVRAAGAGMEVAAERLEGPALASARRHASGELLREPAPDGAGDCGRLGCLARA